DPAAGQTPTATPTPAPGATPAPAPAAEPSAGPIVVRAAVYVLNVGRLDTQSGEFTVDFYLTLTCDRPCDAGNFEFMNGRALSSDLQTDEPAEMLYRIQAALTTNVDVRRYPFDQHRLPVIIEHREIPSSGLVYVADERLSGVDPAVTVGGWELRSWAASVTDHYYAPWDESWSRYEFDVIIERGVISGVFKALLPGLLIVASGFLALLLGPDLVIQRLGINTSAIVGAILFHLTLTSQVPPVGYLTFADKFMLANYIGLISALLATVVLMVIATERRPALAARIHALSRTTIPLAWLGAVALAVFTF
ncbi:MAG: hypothetical protein O3B31_11355, partial [Chloroflexi bacterium]|nr:hypothetical protein [Chloroflexota bacterium]